MVCQSLCSGYPLLLDNPWKFPLLLSMFEENANLMLMLEDHKVEAITRPVCIQKRGGKLANWIRTFFYHVCSSNNLAVTTATEDYSISAISELPSAISVANKKTRTVGIVEPRVVVKIPQHHRATTSSSTKIGRKTLPQENCISKQMVTTSPIIEASSAAAAAPDAKLHQSDVCEKSHEIPFFRQNDVWSFFQPNWANSASSDFRNFPQGATMMMMTAAATDKSPGLQSTLMQ